MATRAINFQERFCATYSCPPERFAEELFYRCFGIQNRFVARILWLMDARCVVEARKCIAEIGRSTTSEQVNEAFLDYHSALDRAHVQNSRLRLSGKSVAKIFHAVQFQK